ncbi:MAG: hypothetical protein HDR08_00275 [Lachnospiraceae bacterium]|nr:hypothetical protein [Lachnospiraceae bacterium]
MEIQKGIQIKMIRDIRSREVKNNPLTVIPEYFTKCWLGGTTLKNSLKNIYIYKKSRGKLREILDNGMVSEDNYVMAAEETFLYGRAGRKVWLECLKRYVVAKLQHKLPEDATCWQQEILESMEDGNGIDEERQKKFRNDLENFDKDHIWMFDAGHNGRRDFRGNPKYLFIYINKYRPDICAYWYCKTDAEEAIKQVRSLGFYGVLQGSAEANYALSRTGVVVSEQIREYLPAALGSAKYLNLWHGIGFKRVERACLLDTDIRRIGVSKKYITNNTYIMNNQLLVVSSPIYESEFAEDFGISNDHMIKAGYLRCMYQKKYSPIVTFEHDIRALKNVAKDTRLAVYAPTYRACRGNAFATGMKNMEQLHQCCEKNRILLIFKVHPYIEKEQGFLSAWQQYGEHSYFFFWDNANDFYEIIDQIDLVIYDYSSMFSDFLCAGVKHFIRYIYDEEEYMVEGFVQGKEAYYERTCGIACHTFEELLFAISHYESMEDTGEIAKIYQKLWAYAGEDDFEKTIQAVLDFKPVKKEYPILYSFDVFDTLISRKGLHPYSVFYAVQEQMKAVGDYPKDLVERYPVIRHSAEMNMREYYRKTTQVRHSEKVEIQMQEIFNRIAEVYGISTKQKKQLMDWEIEEEVTSVVALQPQIDIVKRHIQAGDNVVLISDMYLPKKVVQEMLKKADSLLGELPLFVSSEYGVQKTSGLLYFEVYRSFKPFYSFGKWIHYGDNVAADKTPAQSLGIHTVLVHKPEFNDVEQNLVDTLQCYKAYLTAAMCARLREEVQQSYAKADFVINILGIALIPYVDWVLRDAVEKGFECLYFVARDGYFLKKIADRLVQIKHLSIETKYLYASRRTWRIQSYFDEIDEIFWIEQGGNFNDIHSKEELLKALYLTEEKCRELLPQIDLDGIDWSQKQGRELIPVIRVSEAYQKYLLSVAAEKRKLSAAYLKQELDATKKIAFVEYWGRGDNQECMTRLWNWVTGREEKSYYYYARSILTSEGLCVRYNMTDLDVNVSLMEPVFSNMPYNSIEEYEEVEGVVKPIVQYTEHFDTSLFGAMEYILPQMAEHYAKLELRTPQEWNRKLFDYALAYIQNNQASILVAENIGNLYDSMSMYGKRREYARAYKQEDLKDFTKKIPRENDTSSVLMSYARSSNRVKEEYDEMYQIVQGENPENGVLLHCDEVKLNRSFKKKYEDIWERAEQAAGLYDEACSNYHVYNKICVVSTNRKFDSDTLKILTERLRKQQVMYVELLTADRTLQEDAELMRLLATAKIIIADGNIVQLLKVKFRKGTTCVGLLDRGFRLFRFGRTENVKLRWQYKYNALSHRRMLTATEYTSQECRELCGFEMDLGAMNKLPGACVTDVLFDENYKNEALEKVWTIIPESKNKKIIFYMPLPRKRKNSGEWLEILDLEQLAKVLGEQYFMLIDFRSNVTLANNCKNAINISNFSRDVSKEKISLRSLLVVADIIVGDYRDTFFESALLHKPVFSTAVDLYEMQSNSVNMMYDLAGIYPFPIVKTEEELEKRLKKIEEYDYKPLEEFGNRYLKGCDGRVADRLVESILRG